MDHIKEMGSEIPTEPLVFDKPLSSVMKSGEVMYLKNKNQILHEVELGVLIGMTGKKIKAEDWKDYVEGYFLGIDFTDNDIR